MAAFKVLVRSSAERELRSVPNQDLRRIVKKIQALSENPTPPGSIKLEGETRHRLRQGDWRILYEVNYGLRTIEIVKIGHRREVYR